MARALALSALILLALTACSRAGGAGFVGWYSKHVAGPDPEFLFKRRLAENQKAIQALRNKGRLEKAQASEEEGPSPDSHEPLPREQALATSPAPLEKAPITYSPPLGGKPARAEEEAFAALPENGSPGRLDGRLDSLWERFDRSCKPWNCPISGEEVIRLDRSFRALIREARRSLGPEALSEARRAWVEFRLALGNIRMVQTRYLSAATNYCYALRFTRARAMEEETLAREKFLKAYRKAKGSYSPAKLRHVSGCIGGS